MDAVFNIKKPSGISSFAAVANVRRFLNIARAGHAGTLDPLASGVLLVLAGQATRIAQYLVELPKTYVATVRLGIETDTDDAEGAVTGEHPVEGIDQMAVERVLDHYTGEIRQTPPAFSAVKLNGRPAYKLARAGLPVFLHPRTVLVHSLRLTAFRPPELSLEVTCSKGTYIRSLARDIGRELGCGGMLAELERSAIGNFVIADAIDPATADSAALTAAAIPPARALSFLPELVLNAEQAEAASHGHPITITGYPEFGGPVRLIFNGSLAAIGRMTAPGLIQPQQVFIRQAC